MQEGSRINGPANASVLRNLPQDISRISRSVGISNRIE